MIHLHYQQFTQWLHANPNWAGAVAFFVAFAESIAILGTIIPGSITMTAIGILVGSGVIPITSTLIFAILGAVIGDSISYFTGFYFKNRLTKIWPFNKHPQWLGHANLFFERHGGKSIFLGRFIGPIRAMIPIIAGMLNMRPFRFFPIDIFAAIIWAPLYLLPGYLIGLAAINLPADVATKVILSLLLLLVLFWLIIWFIKETSTFITSLVDRTSNKIWQLMVESKHWHWLCNLLRDANHPEDHGQLVLSFLCLLSITLFLLLFFATVYSFGFLQQIDMAVYHFFRGYRATGMDQLMVLTNSLGSRLALFCLILLIFLWLLVKRNFWAAWHWFLACVPALILVRLFQHLHYVHRPIGIQLVVTLSAFPGIQATVSCACYGFLAWLICLEKSNWKKPVYSLAAIIIGLIFLSQLYLGFHWFSDIVGSFLLGTATATNAAIFYQRKLIAPPKSILLSIAAVIFILFSAGLNIHFNSKQELVNATPVWDKQVVDLELWWDIHSEIVPVYRTTNLGYPAELLNLQWAAPSLLTIKDELKSGGWTEERRSFTGSLLTQLQEEKKISRLVLFPSLYADRRPSLIMSKLLPGVKEKIILKLWPANIELVPEGYSLWVGSINYEHPYGKKIFRHTYHLMPEEMAFTALTRTMHISRWRLLVRPANTIPAKLLPSPDAPHYIILIKPRTDNLTE